MIPIRLREEMQMQVGQEYNFFIHEENGRKYVCIECPAAANEIAKAMELLEKNGMKIMKGD